jgi:uncharacterized C2H2 Zn-finger protein
MAETCIWCDAVLDTRADLEKHVAEQHSLSRGKMKI